MVTHVVMWSFKAGTSDADKKKVMDGLSNRSIPELKSLTIGENKTQSSRTGGYTHLYVGTFDDFDAIKRFQANPDHVPISKLLVEIADGLVVADIVS